MSGSSYRPLVNNIQIITLPQDNKDRFHVIMEKINLLALENTRYSMIMSRKTLDLEKTNKIVIIISGKLLAHDRLGPLYLWLPGVFVNV